MVQYPSNSSLDRNIYNPPPLGEPTTFPPSCIYISAISIYFSPSTPQQPLYFTAIKRHFSLQQDGKSLNDYMQAITIKRIKMSFKVNLGLQLDTFYHV